MIKQSAAEAIRKLSMSPSQTTLRVGDRIQVTVQWIAASGEPAILGADLAYATSEADVAVIDAAGWISAKKFGRATISATHTGVVAST